MHLVCAFILLFAQLAPADEYFGPFHVSILEIRNRIVGFERQSSRELARNIRGIDNVELAIEDWYRHYPRDPWIRGFVARTRHLYQVAGAARSGAALRVASLR